MDADPAYSVKRVTLSAVPSLDADDSSVEKKDVDIAEVSVEDNSEEDPSIGNEPPLSVFEPFPVDPTAPVEEQQFTVRAVLTGCCLGGLIAASNMYLGLKTGWTFGASLFGSIFGYAILKPFSRIAPQWLGGGYFGPKENVCCMSAATAAGSLGLIFASAIPACYQLGLLSSTPKEDFGRLITITLVCAYYGMFFAIPLRKFYILKLKLVFPSAVATAFTIRSLHVGCANLRLARRKTICLAAAFAFAISLRVTSEYAPGIMWDWHVFWWMYKPGGWHGIVAAENWGWVWEWTPAFIGAGMLSGINASYSFWGGSFFAWAVIGPSLVATGKAFGEAINPEKFPGYISYYSMVLDDPVHHPSPRYWLIWPGTLMLIASTFAEGRSTFHADANALIVSTVACNARMIYRVAKSAMESGLSKDQEIFDPAPPEEQVPWWMWSTGLIISIILTCVVLGKPTCSSHQPSLSIVIRLLFAFIGAEAAGRVNVIPVTSIGNASQLILGGVAKGRHLPIKSAQLLNSVSGIVALGASEQAADMLGDLKTTHLLGASPRVQFYAQCCGAIVSIFMSTGLYVVFSTAYPCINDLNLAATCSFPAPDVQSWRAVMVAVTDPSLPIPPSSGFTAIGLAVAAILTVVLKYNYIPAKYHHFVPNWTAIGIGFILNATTYPTAMVFGASVAFLWRRRFGGHFAMYCYPVAAGFIAGEGLGGIVTAVLTIAGVGGSKFGTAVGCPAGEYCG
ncbi:OPT oligopeptide transporter [Punctularia strigosozonata HHB-11173 SS5]|uniref:OPT oligopeptide transporter n=1 Tax=Punctularia strigosozonata (strain HHB-11173) TaxID=741275 RepID=R7RZH1_PUNST|nr:OPT oligopeptide transporter [Punctularia strigosozonata HHB-11173 SS5]EIN03515.1 OPT oligopeptide transporter [Punctularia strigosozonata HHB-11173 SS5]